LDPAKFGRLAMPLSCAGLALALSLSGVHVAQSSIPIAGGKFELQWVRNISVHKPGYAQMPPELPGKLIITSFEGTPFVAKHAVYMLDFDGKNEFNLLPGSDVIDWPNAVTGVSADVFGFPAMALGSGFLVPSHTTGGMWVLDGSANATHLPKPVKITKDKKDIQPDSGWFYHMAEFIDFNGDGRLDVLTSRCQDGVWPFSKHRGELLWLEQPSSSPLSGDAWVEHHLADGPDFLFCLHPDKSKTWLVAPEFIGERMVLYYKMENGTMASRVLDDKSGPGFGCSWADLNGDGRLELLATNHINQNGSVYAYNFDSDDLTTAGVTRHVLATGFSAMSDKTGTASPGDAVAFRPKTSDKGGKMHIFVSGDNSNSIFVLVPSSGDKNDFSYSKQFLEFVGADIGRPAIGDVDGDGFVDIFVPAYDNDAVVHYKFAPAEEAASSPIVV